MASKKQSEEKPIELKMNFNHEEHFIVEDATNDWDGQKRKLALENAKSIPHVYEVLDKPYESVFAILEKQGIAELHIGFSGGNDSGGADEYFVIRNKKNVLENVDYSQIDHSFKIFAEKPIYNKYYGFAWNGEVSGSCVWNVKDKTVNLVGTETNFDSDYNQYDL